ncbi:OLC1v1023118C1 [Oldenlandia corymbosa var. corymbosa]|uniref:OLC1v1023118C1 n=1 Tax=Oldenlandia corymbosa var. corymbosa TaxID=529605 RepID=A0AAV1BZ76_OLDCO|nr:OLC1v1023118C1 [Oldenlandia corymbosa var. corymbosa]
MGSSSKRKHSKTKSSKLSSKARKLKKSKRTKAKKKLGRRHDSSTDNSMSSYSSDSYSSNSDDDSISSKSLSSSSSKDTHRRKSISRSRSTKKRKKQLRRISSSREDSRDLSRSRKRKRSKKNSVSKSSKNSKRKKLRRDVEISSASSHSPSCSTCNGSIGGESSEGEGVRRRSRKNKDGRRDKPHRKIQSTLSPHRSSTHSPYSEYRDENYPISQGEETCISEKNSRRLKSVIVFAEKPEPSITDQNESEKDMQKEELVYDHDDYPSKSSSGEGGKKEVSTPYPLNMFDGGRSVENVGLNSDNDVIEQSIGYAREHEQDDVRNPSSNDFMTNSYEKKRTSNILLPDSGSSGNDLEAVLKQKALENLKKFRGARKTNVKPTAHKTDQVNGDRHGSSSSQAEIVQSKFPIGSCTEVEKDASGGGLARKVSEIIERNSDDTPGQANFGKPNEKSRPMRQPVFGKSALENSSFGKTSSVIDSTQNPTRSSMVSMNKSHMETETSLRNPESKIAHLKSPSISTSQDITSTSSLVGSAAVEQPSSNNQQDEGKDGSQYQQKTMSVMRNGEMVQVNYKVYIPQRAPGLARRHFKR